MKRSIIRIGVSVLASAIVGVFLTVVGVGELAPNMFISASIGVVAAISTHLLGRFEPLGVPRPIIYVLGLACGAVVGAALLALVYPGPRFFQQSVVVLLATTLVFGGAMSAVAFLHRRKSQLEEDLHAAELRKLEAERSVTEARLKMLQAQIEPHFLFNTLANVTALIGTDPSLARRLLDRLNVYLRAALTRTRAGSTTLGDEMDLLRAYLDICRIRMGERLRYAIDVPQPLLARPFPPMLLQPLVENAVKHGLEPKLGDGELRIAASNHDTRLYISVVDNGVGFGDSHGGGTGVTNVRARLAALYGDAARLTLEERAQGGVSATLELPA